MKEKLTGKSDKHADTNVKSQVQPVEGENETLRLTADLEGNYLLEERVSDLKWLAIFYAPAGGSVHHVAKILKQKIGPKRVDMFCVSDIPASKMLDYKNMILLCSSLGRSTWEREQRDRWAKFFPAMRKLSLKDRRVALVGLGDHVTYPANFVDGMGYMAEMVTELGAELVGKTPTDGYVFNSSSAIVDNLFVGLPLDEDYEPEKTQSRLDKWLSMVLPEFADI